MRIYILLLLLISASFISAQQSSFGFGAGATISWAERPNHSYYKNTAGKTFDGFYLFEKGKFITKATAGFCHKGFNQTVIFVDTSGNILGQGDIERNRFSYLFISETAGVRYGDRFHGYTTAGVSLYYYLKTNVKLEETLLDNGYLYPGYNFDASNLKRLDFSLTAETAFFFKINDGNDILLIVNYNHGIAGIRYRDVETSNPWKNHHLSIKIGLRKIIL